MKEIHRTHTLWAQAGHIRSTKVLPFVVPFGMGKIRRGNYIFVSWQGDHSPRHVHVYRDSKLVLKWDLERQRSMEGKANRRIVKLIRKLESGGLL
jgi:hypothetical protein